METQREVGEYFRGLELALNEQEKKGIPKETPRTAGYIPNSPRDLGHIGIARDELLEPPRFAVT